MRRFIGLVPHFLILTIFGHFTLYNDLADLNRSKCCADSTYIISPVAIKVKVNYTKRCCPYRCRF